MFHPNQSRFNLFFPGTKVDYQREVGQGLESNVLMAPVNYIGRAWNEARFAVKMKKGDEMVVDDMHPLAMLVRSPNEFYSGAALWTATVLSYALDGNAYWIKVRGARGKTSELWYVPHWLMEPKWKGGDFITGYQYSVGGAGITLPPEDVVHIRAGIDPDNVRKGLSPIKSALREVFIDSEASNFVAALFKNKGIPGIIISPKGDIAVSPEDQQTIKQYIKDKFTGDKRFEPMALGAPTDVQTYGFNPQELDMTHAHNLSEERVCALLGLPAAIVGFGAGLEQTKVGATMSELRKLAWTDCIAPMQNLIAADVSRALMQEFGNPDNEEAVFDRSEVGALQEDMDKIAERMDRAVRGGWATVAEARNKIGLETDDSHKIFLRPISAFEVTDQGQEIVRDVEDPGTDDGKGVKEHKGLTRLQARVIRAMDRNRRHQERSLRDQMTKFFEDFGKVAEEVWNDIGKAIEDAPRVELLFNRIDLPKHEDDLRKLMGQFYVGVFSETAAIAAGVGLAVNIPDAAELDFLRMGGRRAGLVDLSKRARERVFDVLEEAREEGLGVPQTARRLRDKVPAGPWTSPKVRAEIIARTEAQYAQTRSALETYRNTEGATRAMILDARLGPTDLDCELANGQVMSFEEADDFLEEEHPNGTRDLVPVFEEQ